MRLTLPLLLVSLLVPVALAQPKGPQPQLAACGPQGEVEIICGTHSPEDFELTPDGKYLIVAEFVGPDQRGGGTGLQLFELAAKSFRELPITDEPDAGWGEAACPGPIGNQMRPHGISLAGREGGVQQLFVVNHGGRQSMEMFELRPAGDSWQLAWHGCVLATEDYNDVAALPDGSFVATRPTALQSGGGGNALGGDPTGNVARWTRPAGESELPGTRLGYPNGVLVSADGRYAYIDGWTTRDVHKYDLQAGREVAVVELDFMPDNITWTSDGKLIAAGIKGARGDCGGAPCNQAFGVAEIDPGTMQARKLFDSEGRGALISGVSVAIRAGGSLYVGAFQGDRIVRIGE